MVILDKYIRKIVVGNILAVITVLISLFAVISFSGEFSKIGQGNYTILLAVKYTLLKLPTQAYELVPVASLLGVMLGMGGLANRSELIIIRASGVTLNRIAFSVLKAAFIVILLGFLIGEFVAPNAKQYGQQLWLKALNRNASLNTHSGLWMRDGDKYVHVQSVSTSGTLQGIEIFTFDENHNIKLASSAESATYDKDTGWQINNVKKSFIDMEGIKTESYKVLYLDNLLPPDIIKIVSIKPSMLSVWRLYQYIKYLKSNGLNSLQYELSFWNKVAIPISIFAMVMLAIPLIFGLGRGASTGKRIVIGFLIGIAFFIGNRLIGQASIANNIHPIFSAFAPSIFIIMGSYWVLHRNR
ncbi:MAG: LPS export ABC transporter permease LptG [Gammaproteobacteria bacterium]